MYCICFKWALGNQNDTPGTLCFTHPIPRIICKINAGEIWTRTAEQVMTLLFSAYKTYQVWWDVYMIRDITLLKLMNINGDLRNVNSRCLHLMMFNSWHQTYHIIFSRVHLPNYTVSQTFSVALKFSQKCIESGSSPHVVEHTRSWILQILKLINMGGGNNTMSNLTCNLFYLVLYKLHHQTHHKIRPHAYLPHIINKILKVFPKTKMYFLRDIKMEIFP